MSNLYTFAENHVYRLLYFLMLFLNTVNRHGIHMASITL